jgi:hypothetical protein
MKKAESHIVRLGLYEILRQPSNILAKPCQFKILQYTHDTTRWLQIPIQVHLASIAAPICASVAISDITALPIS